LRVETTRLDVSGSHAKPQTLVFGESMVHLYAHGRFLRSEDQSSESANAVRYCKVRHEFDNRSLSESDALGEWRDLITWYSFRSLTYEAKILPALSSLARRWPGKIKGQYLAGLFSPGLHRQLLWTHNGTATTPEQILSPGPEAIYTAPSWSWASRLSSVSWVDMIFAVFNPEFQLLKSELTLDGLDPYGRVKAGYLVLSTRICGIPATRLQRKHEILGVEFTHELLSEDGTCLAHLRFDWRHTFAKAPVDPETGEER
jgi:hypothetical protein